MIAIPPQFSAPDKSTFFLYTCKEMRLARLVGGSSRSLMAQPMRPLSLAVGTGTSVQTPHDKTKIWQ